MTPCNCIACSILRFRQAKGLELDRLVKVHGTGELADFWVDMLKNSFILDGSTLPDNSVYPRPPEQAQPENQQS